MRLEIASDHIDDVMRLVRKIDDYNRRIVTETNASGTTLTLVHGVGPINAAVILGEVGDVSRCPSRDHFASYSGVAPISASSGDHQRHRLPAQDRRGQDSQEALRCMKRRVSDAVRRRLRIDRSDDHAPRHEMASPAVEPRASRGLSITRNTPPQRGCVAD